MEGHVEITQQPLDKLLQGRFPKGPNQNMVPGLPCLHVVGLTGADFPAFVVGIWLWAAAGKNSSSTCISLRTELSKEVRSDTYVIMSTVVALCANV